MASLNRPIRDDDGTDNIQVLDPPPYAPRADAPVDAHVESSAKRNWKKYAIIGGVLAVAIIAAIVIALTVESAVDLAPQNGFHLDDVLSSKYRVPAFNGTWAGENMLIFFNKNRDIVKFNPIMGVETILLPNEGGVTDFSISADQQYLLLRFETKPIFRHSHLSIYVAVHILNKERINISANSDAAELQLALWSPTGSEIVFVQKNNLYYKNSVHAEAIPITKNTEARIYNGVCDWIYEEEIFGSNQAVWFSPDGKSISYIQFDDSFVREMVLPIFGEPGTIESQYPTERTIDYPKVDTRNPSVRLYTVQLESASTSRVDRTQLFAPLKLRNQEHIITGVYWRDSQNLVSTWTNRVQNYSIVQTCKSFQCSDIIETSQHNGWIEPNQNIVFNADGSHMAMILYAPSVSIIDNQAHIHIVNVNNGSKYAVTKGQFNVQRILKWETRINRIFYLGNENHSPETTHLYVVAPYEDDTLWQHQCLTCYRNIDGLKQNVFSVNFSPESNFYLISSLGPSIPRTDVFEYRLLEHQHLIEVKHTSTINSNDGIREMLKGIEMPNVLDFLVPLGSHEAHVKMWTPAKVDISGTHKFPMLIHVYGGPNAFQSTDQWGIGWQSYLASNKSVVVVQIDGRGSGRRDDASLFAVYRNLGTVEIEDQLTVAQYLAANYKYVDADRVGIWGWSYGGYASAMALAKDKKNFIKCAASVAPVTDWIYYDSMYTERYMGPYKDNVQGYKEASLIEQYNNFRNKSLFIVHGTLDDNVHYQQSMALARVLEVNDIAFEQMSYADQDHRLTDVTPHLYHELNRFFGKCFGIELN